MVSFVNCVHLMMGVVGLESVFDNIEGEDEEDYVYEDDYVPKRKRGRQNSLSSSNYASSNYFM